MKAAGIIITGSAKGIGEALTAHFARLGMQVFAIDRDEKAGQKSAERINNTLTECDGRVRFVCLDVTSAAEVAKVFSRLPAENSGITRFINNVGETRAETYAALDPTQWQTEMNLNMNSAYYCCHALMPAFIKRAGVMLFIGSVNGFRYYGNPAYSAAKAALHNMVFSLAAEYGRHGLRINAICPGSVKTVAWEQRLAKRPQLMQTLRKYYPLGRLVCPQDIADAAEFLLSDKAAAISGVLLPVDCGLSVGNIGMAAEITDSNTNSF